MNLNLKFYIKIIIIKPNLKNLNYMFAREKFSKSNQFFNNNQNTSKNIISSNKYFQKPFYKNQKQNSKKYKCDRLRKKNSLFYWSEKENDKNNLNYLHNKKYHFEGRKTFHFHKKSTKTKFDYNFIYNEEEKNENKMIENENEFKNDECGLSKENSKDEKNNSIEYTTTTTAYSQSNSSSAHEDMNSINSINYNNSGKIIDKLNLNNYSNKQDLVIKKYSSSDAIPYNKRLSMDLSNDLTNQFFSNLMKINMNLIRFNSNEIKEYIPSHNQKGQNKRKYSEGNSSNHEPYNKYNSVNQELNNKLINPMNENTEILNVSVKISKNKRAVFKLRRFDDLFLTVKLFCEINQIDEKLMKPIIIKTLCSLNSIFQIYNFHLDEKNMERLRRINSFINNTYI